MKKTIIIAASVFLLAAGCQKTQPVKTGENPPATSTPDQTAGWNSYTSPDKYGFSLKYGEGFGFATDKSQVTGISYIPVCDENMVACVYMIRQTFAATNFDGAGVSINIDPTLNTEAKCYNFAVSTSEAQTVEPDVTINGTVFKSATGGGGAAGHFDKLQIYRNFHNNMCFEIAQDMAETNIGNYPAGTVQPFDENAVWQDLQGVVNTFRFTK